MIPVLVALVTPEGQVGLVVAGMTIVALVRLGGLGASAGGAGILKGAAWDVAGADFVPLVDDRPEPTRLGLNGESGGIARSGLGIDLPHTSPGLSPLPPRWVMLLLETMPIWRKRLSWLAVIASVR